jgi:hypothetical protein
LPPESAAGSEDGQLLNPGKKTAAPARLPQNVVRILLRGHHARAGGKTSRERASNLARIAASYSRDELLSEKGLGPASVADIEGWLINQGLRFRTEETDPAES